MVDKVLLYCGKLLEWISFEVLLTRSRRANGGTIILVRAFLTSLLLYFAAIVIKQAIDPTRTWQFSWLELRLELLRSMHWFAAAFAGVYTALYTRFAAQWTYLANLYNQIKQAEVRAVEKAGGPEVMQKLSQWKAGFLEDAEVLHLASKPVFAAVICAWASDTMVKDSYEAFTPGGSTKFTALLEKIRSTCEKRADRCARCTFDRVSEDDRN